MAVYIPHINNAYYDHYNSQTWMIIVSHLTTFPHTSDTYVTAESGTGVVHQAPGFGEDDFRVCQHYGIIKKGDSVVCPVDASGRFTEEVLDFKGQYVKVGVG